MNPAETPLTCDRCGIFGDPRPGEVICDDCKAELGRAALTTQVLPTSGDWYAQRGSRNELFVKFGNGGIVTEVEVVNGFVSDESASNTAVLSMAKALYEHVLKQAQDDPDDYDANELIAITDERFLALMQSTSKTSFICKESP